MQRRALLAAIPAALAGCTASPPGSTATRTTTTQPTEPGTSYVVTDLAVETETVGPQHRYLVRITKVYSADAVSKEPGTQEVVDVSEVENRAVRSVIEDVLTDGKVRRDSIPDGLRETVDHVDFFTWNETTDPDDTASHWAIEVFDAEPDRDPPLRFDASLTDHAVSPDDPAAVTFAIENGGAKTQEVFSGTVPPFSLVWADGPDHERYLLWRDYEDEGCVTFDDEYTAVCDIGKITQIEPGETIEKTYQLRPENPVGSPLQTGDYVVSDTLTYHEESQGPSTELEWRVSFSVERP